MSVNAPSDVAAQLQMDATCDVTWENGETYDSTLVRWRQNIAGAAWSSSSSLAGDAVSYSITASFTVNIEYKIRVEGYVSGAFGSDIDYVTRHKSDEVTTDSTFAGTITFTDVTSDEDFVIAASAVETLSMTDAEAIQWDFVLSGTDTVTVTDNIVAIGALSEDADYQYYFGDFNGKIYAESPEYTSDDSEEIESYLVTKETDMAEQEEEALDAFKTIYFVRLWYVDRYTDTTVLVGVSKDGGTTYIEEGKSIGTADGAMKSQDFFFQITGQVFKYRVRNLTTTDKFQWAAIEVYYTLSGDYFVL